MKHIMNDGRMKKLAPVVLRLGLSVVFVWFGSNQLLHPSIWSGLIPSSIVSLTGLSAVHFVLINGIFEIIMAIFLAVGIWIRVVGILLALHLVSIISVIGLNDVGMRDTGLFFAMVSVALQGADAYSYDTRKILAL